MKRIVFDIETGPLPEAEIAPYAPEFSAPSNYKDQTKIDAYIAAQKQEWLSKAALSPVTGRVLAVGYMRPAKDGPTYLDLDIQENEQYLLRKFWDVYTDNCADGAYIGFNIKRFDLPFLARRSWKLGVKVPPYMRHGRYWADEFIDLYELWRLGNSQDSISLANLSRFLGIGEKAGSGADFAAMPRQMQEQYLAKDLELTAKAAEIMLPLEWGEKQHRDDLHV